jgi:hypothetical protein
MACHNKRESGYQSADMLSHRKTLVEEIDIKTTTHYCKARIVNRWKKDITDVTLRHRRGNDPKKEDKKSWDSVQDDKDTDTMDITFETGFGSSGDYWWVEFRAAGEKWTCKENFYCDLRSNDEGSTVDCILKAIDEEMHISMNSGSCDVELYKK